MFEKASRMKLRFNVACGLISTEDLWDLTLGQLNTLAKKLNKEVKALEEEDFLGDIKTEDTALKLKFDLVLHVLNAKKEAKRLHLEFEEKKARKEKLLTILARKQDTAMESKTEEEILQELSDLG